MYFPQPLVRPEAHIPSVCTELCNPEGPKKMDRKDTTTGYTWPIVIFLKVVGDLDPVSQLPEFFRIDAFAAKVNGKVVPVYGLPPCEARQNPNRTTTIW